MIEHSIGSPIVLGRPTDLLGLSIAEGIEKTPAMHEVTGVSARVAGSAAECRRSLPPRLRIDCVSVVIDDDRDGRRHMRRR
jgi:hypothetical protein